MFRSNTVEGILTDLLALQVIVEYFKIIIS